MKPERYSKTCCFACHAHDASGTSLHCSVYLAEHAFGNNEEMVRELGSALWPKLAQAYVDCCMKPDQDQFTDAALLHHFKTAEQFETAAVQLL